MNELERTRRTRICWRCARSNCPGIEPDGVCPEVELHNLTTHFHKMLDSGGSAALARILAEMTQRIADLEARAKAL